MASWVPTNVEVPPGGWTFTVPATGYEVRAASRPWLISKTRDYYQANNIKIPYDLEDIIDNVICERCLQGKRDYLCDYSDEPTLVRRVKKFAIASKEWVRNGCPLVSETEFQHRMEQCAGSETVDPCQYWNGETSFGFVACGKCGCLRQKLGWATEHCPISKW
jgi:hypothetical protein